MMENVRKTLEGRHLDFVKSIQNLATITITFRSDLRPTDMPQNPRQHSSQHHTHRASSTSSNLPAPRERSSPHPTSHAPSSTGPAPPAQGHQGYGTYPACYRPLERWVSLFAFGYSGRARGALARTIVDCQIGRSVQVIDPELRRLRLLVRHLGRGKGRWDDKHLLRVRLSPSV